MSVPSNNKISSSNSLSKNALTNKDFFFGVKDGDDYGPTSATGFYNGVAIPLGGYVIYFNNSGTITADAPTNDAQCLNLLNRYGASAANISDALTWAASQSNIVVQSSPYVVNDLPGGVTPTPTPTPTPTSTEVPPTPTPTPTPSAPPTLYAVSISTVYESYLSVCGGNANITAYSTNNSIPQLGDIYYTTGAGTTTYGAGFYKNSYDAVIELNSSGVMVGGPDSC